MRRANQEGKLPKVGILHYTAPAVVGGVEAVMAAHAQVLAAAGYPVRVISGRGDAEALPAGVELALLPEMDSQHERVREINAALEMGNVPADYEALRDELTERLREVLGGLNVVFIHNVLTKHFNLPLTGALFRLMEEKAVRGVVMWTHDISWTSEHSRPMLREKMPWDLLRARPPGAALVTISNERRAQLAGLLRISEREIRAIPNGVDARAWLGIGDEGWRLIQRLKLLEAGVVMFMPVRITQAKNLELAARVTAELKRRGSRPKLVVTGPPDPHDALSQEYYQRLVGLRAGLGLREEIGFVYEMNGAISQSTVSDLLRASDVLFLTSHREGFGMPVLEAGLAGVPVVSSRAVPAAVEIGGEDVTVFHPSDSVEQIAELVLQSGRASPAARLKRKVRQMLTWEAIFEKQIEPLIEAVVKREEKGWR